jgi:hypothetical protein
LINISQITIILYGIERILFNAVCYVSIVNNLSLFLSLSFTQENHGLLHLELGHSHHEFHVRVVAAEDLDKQDVHRLSSVYVRLHLGDRLLGTTQASVAAVHPVWSSSSGNDFSLPLSELLELEANLETQIAFYKTSMGMPTTTNVTDHNNNSASMERERRRGRGQGIAMNVDAFLSLDDFEALPDFLNLVTAEVFELSSSLSSVIGLRQDSSMGKASIPLRVLRRALPDLPLQSQREAVEEAEKAEAYRQQQQRHQQWQRQWPQRGGLSWLGRLVSHVSQSATSGSTAFASMVRMLSRRDSGAALSSPSSYNGLAVKAVNKETNGRGSDEGSARDIEAQEQQLQQQRQSLLISDNLHENHDANDDNSKESMVKDQDEEQVEGDDEEEEHNEDDEEEEDEEEDDDDPEDRNIVGEVGGDYEAPQQQQPQSFFGKALFAAHSTSRSLLSALPFSQLLSSSQDRDNNDHTGYDTGYANDSNNNNGNDKGNDDPIQWSDTLRCPITRASTEANKDRAKEEELTHGSLVLRLLIAQRGSVCVGIDSAIQRMTLGESAVVKCRFDALYGSCALSSRIPPRANAIMRIRLLDVEGLGMQGIVTRTIRRVLRLLGYIVMWLLVCLQLQSSMTNHSGRKKQPPAVRRLLIFLGLSKKRSGVDDNDSNEDYSNGDGSDNENDEDEDELFGSDDLIAGQQQLEQQQQHHRVDKKMRKHLTPSVKEGVRLLWGADLLKRPPPSLMAKKRPVDEDENALPDFEFDNDDEDDNNNNN